MKCMLLVLFNNCAQQSKTIVLYNIFNKLTIPMYSRYNYSPSSPPSLHYNQSTSIQHFYRKASSPRSHHFQPLHFENKQCKACRHQKKISTKALSSRYQPIKTQAHSHKQEYYQTSNQDQITNLRKTLRFLENLLQQNKQEHKSALQKNEAKFNQLIKQIQQQNTTIELLEKKLSNNQLIQQFASNSLVGPYIDKGEEHQEEKQELRFKISQLLHKIERLEGSNEVFQQTIEQNNKFKIIYQNLQPKLKEYEIYQRQYESMKLLIHKMEIDQEETNRKQTKTINQLQKKHKKQLDQYAAKLNQAHSQLRQKTMQIEQKSRQIEKTRNMTLSIEHSHFEHLEQLLQQKNQQVDKLESKLTCIESELTFLKNRYGYLLKLTKTGVQNNQIGSHSDLEEYCIERIGRHNLSNGKESLIGLNLSPIKRR